MSGLDPGTEAAALATVMSQPGFWIYDPGTDAVQCWVSSWCALKLCSQPGCEEDGCQCECHGLRVAS